MAYSEAHDVIGLLVTKRAGATPITKGLVCGVLAELASVGCAVIRRHFVAAPPQK
jgi:hypothetical protein